MALATEIQRISDLTAVTSLTGCVLPVEDGTGDGKKFDASTIWTSGNDGALSTLDAGIFAGALPNNFAQIRKAAASGQSILTQFLTGSAMIPGFYWSVPGSTNTPEGTGASANFWIYEFIPYGDSSTGEYGVLVADLISDGFGAAPAIPVRAKIQRATGAWVTWKVNPTVESYISSGGTRTVNLSPFVLGEVRNILLRLTNNTGGDAVITVSTPSTGGYDYNISHGNIAPSSTTGTITLKAGIQVAASTGIISPTVPSGNSLLISGSVVRRA